MKTIFKHGKRPKENPVKGFECSVCGCIFTCGPDEWFIEKDGMRRTIYSDCPECNGISFVTVTI